MNLGSDKRQNVQGELDFSSPPAGEAREAKREETESPSAMHGPESPASTNRLMEEICERENLKQALQQVKANKGSAGVDGMTVGGITDYLKQHWPAIREQLLSGTYEPKPVRRVEIPKPDGGVRKLGIPTVLDRLIQQAVMQVLQKQWDSTFSVHSYGFRLGEVFRSSQSRQTDGSDRKTSRGQTAVETRPGILECWGDGERTGQPKRGRHSPRRSTFPAAVQPHARRTRP